MSYTVDMRSAARRLIQAANNTFESDRAVAAYLLGLATECALKFVATSLRGGNAGDIQWGHFPELRQALRAIQTGRRAAALRRLIESDAFMNEWHIKIRYARKEDIQNKPIDQWRRNATDALNLMEGWR